MYILKINFNINEVRGLLGFDDLLSLSPEIFLDCDGCEIGITKSLVRLWTIGDLENVDLAIGRGVA